MYKMPKMEKKSPKVYLSTYWSKLDIKCPKMYQNCTKLYQINQNRPEIDQNNPKIARFC